MLSEYTNLSVVHSVCQMLIHCFISFRLTIAPEHTVLLSRLMLFIRFLLSNSADKNAKHNHVYS